MKTILKPTRRRETRRKRQAFAVRIPSPMPRDLIAWAAALEVLG